MGIVKITLSLLYTYLLCTLCSSIIIRLFDRFKKGRKNVLFCLVFFLKTIESF